MIREITLIDFMSHRHTIIEPASGLTVLVGPNNCGKSAVVAALQILSANSRKDHMIRHGCKECAITVETDDGHTVTWRRKGKTVNYTIDGRDIHRLEGDVPDGLHDVLKLAPVESAEGGDLFDVHFATQKDPIFLLNGTGKQAAAFFASSSDASHLMAMQQRHKEKVREHGQTEKLLTTQVASLTAYLGALETVPALETATDAAARTYQQLTSQAQAMAQLEESLQALAEHCAQLRQVEDQCGALSVLRAPPSLEDIQSLDRLIQESGDAAFQIRYLESHRQLFIALQAPPILVDLTHLSRLCDDIGARTTEQSYEHTRAQLFESLRGPPTLTDVIGLERYCGALEHASRMLHISHAFAATVQCIPTPPILEDTNALETTINALASAVQQEQHCKRATNIFGDLESPPELVGDDILAATIETYALAQRTLGTLQREFEEIEQQREALRMEITRWSDANPTCPICGAAMDSTRLLATEGHHHG